MPHSLLPGCLVVGLRLAALMLPVMVWLTDVPATAAEEPAAATVQFSAEQVEFFERQVRPLLVTHCFECHSGADEETTRGGLRLDSRAAVLTGGDTGPAAEPGRPEASLLIDAVNYGDLYQMPPKSKLSAEEIDVLTRWVQMNLPWGAEPANNAPSRNASSDPQQEVLARQHEQWSWRQLERPTLPAVRDGTWPRDPIDNFILAKLEQHELHPAAPASRAMLIRRAYFDLIGLPPTIEEVRAFEADGSQQAYAAMIDRLLRSPHFGERWGRHWLDLVRYAESRGHEFDFDVPNAFEYRDYVIRAFNADVPYDQFVREHIAGDLLAQPRLNPASGFNESILGTGFWFLGEWVHSPVDIRKDECDRFDNMVDVFSKTFLGLTVACARCHDHKFDPILQRDYYSLFGYLQSSTYRQVRFETLESDRELARQLYELDAAARQKTAELLTSSWQPAIGQSEALLLAARQVVLTQRTSGTSGDLPPDQTTDDQLAAVAQQHHVPVTRLQAWVARLRAAAADRSDPLWIWSQPDAALQTWYETTTPAVPELPSADIVINYGDSGPQQWFTDGFAFGAGPVRPGQLLLARDVNNLSVARRGFAARDAAWQGLALAPGTVAEPGRLGTRLRSGQTLRTPTFTITHGPVHFLVRGSGVAYAAVDSHAMLAGPLHNVLLKEFTDDGNSSAWRWETQDLSRYQQHGAHLEFSPIGDARLEIAMVIQAPVAPTLPDATALAAFAAQPQVNDFAALAARYREQFQAACALVRSIPAQSETPASERLAALAHWMLGRDDLFSHGQMRDELARQLQQYHEQREQLAAQIQSTSRTAPAMWDGDSVDERLLVRGNPRTEGPVVPRGFLSAFTAGHSEPPAAGSGRLQLAEHLLDPSNPFTARVVANRVWQHLLGRGLAASPDNFGSLGEEPTHPQLLDHLAVSLIDDGWSLKRLIRRIMLSNTYQMSSAPRPEADERDPQNKLLHRAHIRRLEGEVIRDAMLSISGRLDRTMYGPSVPVHLTPFMEGRGRPKQSGPLDGDGRRSIYIAVRRNFLSPMMLAFDTPQPFSTVGRRSESNVPAQALIMLNDPLVIELARQWAQRTLDSAPASVAAAIEQMYLASLGRLPDASETAAAREFLEQQCAELGLDAARPLHNQAIGAWADLAHVLLNTKEFLFLQ